MLSTLEPTEVTTATMIRVDRDSSEWLLVSNDFTNRWKKSNITNLCVEDIVRIKCPAHLEEAYTNYKSSLQRKAAIQTLSQANVTSTVLSKMPVSAPLPIGDFELETELYHGTSACISQAVFEGRHLQSSCASAPSQPSLTSFTDDQNANDDLNGDDDSSFGN
ncbi:hypothetical protein DFQ26_004626 [Actinomortierella ambigua]|nr:hypothetical protein DFQ26_004626 [Actinomortierella ambigua]